MADEQILRIVRVLEYSGPRDWLLGTIKSSRIAPTLSESLPDTLHLRGEIREVYVSAPRLVAEARDTSGYVDDAAVE